MKNIIIVKEASMCRSSVHVGSFEMKSCGSSEKR